MNLSSLSMRHLKRWKQIERGKKEIIQIKKDVKTQQLSQQIMDRTQDYHEQYSRTKCLFIQGISENEKVNTDERNCYGNSRKRNTYRKYLSLAQIDPKYF